MFLELDGSGPLYMQLARALRTAILDGRMGAGTRLPPTRVLARELELSRATVETAYEQLRADGMLEGRVGSGSYVARVQADAADVKVRQDIAPPSRYARRAREAWQPGIARLHYGLPYNLQYGDALINAALGNAWRRALAHAADRTVPEITHVQGSPRLRGQICDYLARRRGVRAAPGQVLVVSGTQQAITLTARVLLDEGAPVVLEEPHYFGLHQALLAHGAHLRAVRSDDDGLVCEELPEAAPRLVCVTPSHQFPTGAALSPARRQALLRYASARGCWILEDDYDSEFRYDSHPLPALRALDADDRVIYVGTFSKVLFGSLRLAYMVLPEALVRDFLAAKFLDDIACPGIEQAALAHFMESGGFERHLRHARNELKRRRQTLVEGLRQHAGERIEIVDSPAGMHVLGWLNGYDPARADALIALARGRGLGLYPAAPHYRDPPRRPGLLLGFCGLSPGALRTATRLLGECMDDMETRDA